MSIYFVDGATGDDANDGGSTTPFKTLGRANGEIRAGDTVKVRTAVYHEALTIRTPDTVWQSDTGHKPVIDGRYGPELLAGGKMPKPGASHLPVGAWSNLVNIGANGVVFDGFAVRNSAGTGIGIGDADDVVIRDCIIDFVYDLGIKVHAGSGWADRVLIEDNLIINTSVRRIAGETTWSSGIGVTRMRDGIIRGNVIGYGHGEGVDIHQGSLRVLFEANTVYTCKRCHVYIQHASEVTIKDNVIFHNGDVNFMNPGEGIIQGDETGSKAYPRSTDNVITGNLVVNCTPLFTVRSNVTGSYNDSQFLNTTVRNNTFIGGPLTRAGVSIAPNMLGHPHAGNTFENNIIAGIPDGRPIADGNPQGVAFGYNLWETLPPELFRGANDVMGDPLLIDMAAPLEPFNVVNYHLTGASPAIDAAAGGGDIGAFDYTPPEPEPEPEPDPDWIPLLADVYAALGKLEFWLNEQ